MERIYLDNNATTFIDPRVVDVICKALQSPMGNPSSLHSFGQTAKGLISSARRTIANFFPVKQNQIIFTSGGTEGAALTLKGVCSSTPRHIIASSLEHTSVHEILEQFQRDGASVSYLPTDESGKIAWQSLPQLIRKETQLITVMAANNETGVINDIDAIAEIALSHSIPFVVDGVAILGKEKFAIPLGVTAMFFSGHKIHAPQGVGFAFLRKKLNAPLLKGHQEFGMRGGTENMLGIISLAEAISLLTQEQERAIAKMRSLRDLFESELLKIPGVLLNGCKERVSNTSNLAFNAIDGENLLIALDQAGIAASLGSACSSGAISASRVLINMGFPLARVRSSLRFSLSRFTTQEEIYTAIALIKRIIAKF